MNSCHNATKNDRQWCHHFTIFVGQATARMASQENQPSSCDVAGSAMPREDALLNLTSPSWEKSAIPPKKKITSQIHAVSTFPWPFWICFVSVACSELRLMHYGHVTQQLWFRCQVCHCHLMFWMFEMLDVLFMNVFGCCIWICHAAIEKIYIGHLSPVICHLSPVICPNVAPNVAVTEAVHDDVEESIDEQWWDEPVVSFLQTWGCAVGDEPELKLNSNFVDVWV